jgi:hypothetical protein
VVRRAAQGGDHEAIIGALDCLDMPIEDERAVSCFSETERN